MRRWHIATAAGLGLVVGLAGCGKSIDALSKVDGGPGGAGTATGTGGAASSNAGGVPGTGAGGSGNAGLGGAAGITGSGGAGLLAACGILGTSQLPRLTNEQYDRTVRDLLNVTALTALGGAAPSSMLPTSRGGGLTEVDWASYVTASEAIAAQVMADPNLAKRFLLCTPTGDGAACLHDTIVQFGRRAFRRPLTDSEVARFQKLIDARAQITATGAAPEVAEALLQAFLVSPSFLHRSEIAGTADAKGNVTLSSYEVASRLSYLLWGSTPDDLLDRAADANALSTKEQLRAQAERMLRDDKARDLLTAFHRFYVQAGPNTRWSSMVKKDAALFPGFSDAVVAAMNAETDRFFDAVVVGQHGSFQDLFTSTRGFVNRETAAIYGLDPLKFGAALQDTTLDATQRPGFLTRLGFLAAFSNFGRSSPILRGAFIATNVQGMPLAPPASAFTSTPLPSGAELTTNRARVTAQTAAAACEGCHKKFLNPPGFVLEAYNSIGAWQTIEAETGAPIDTVADVVIDGIAVTVRDPADLMKKLAASVEARRTYATRWVAYAYERNTNPVDACTADVLAANLNHTGYAVLDLVVDLTQTESFRIRTLEAP